MRQGDLKRQFAEMRRSESGATMIIVALVLIVLMGMAGFAIDYGWLYWNGVKIQHGADAAALAGVVYEPGDQATAYTEALGAASENGYANLSPDSTVTPVDFIDDPTAVENANQLVVTVSHTVPTFFMKVFGIDTVTITKRAVAEYALPLAMGSDLPYFGEDPALGRNPNFWANIHGCYTPRKFGDRSASQCNNNTSTSSCPKNPERRETLSAGTNNGIADLTGGYLYAIEVPAGAANLSVDILDGPFFRGGGDFVLVGDQEMGAVQDRQRSSCCMDPIRHLSTQRTETSSCARSRTHPRIRLRTSMAMAMSTLATTRTRTGISTGMTSRSGSRAVWRRCGTRCAARHSTRDPGYTRSASLWLIRDRTTIAA